MKFNVQKKTEVIFTSAPFQLVWFRPEEVNYETFRLILKRGWSGIFEGEMEIWGDMSWGNPAYGWCAYRGIQIWPDEENCRVGLYGMHPDWDSVSSVDQTFPCSNFLCGFSDRHDELSKQFGLQHIRLEKQRKLAIASELLKESLAQFTGHPLRVITDPTSQVKGYHQKRFESE